jgi:hypothetical protein
MFSLKDLLQPPMRFSPWGKALLLPALLALALGACVERQKHEYHAYHKAMEGKWYEYPVKFLCGRPNAPLLEAQVAPGRYFTAINIHNPDLREARTFWYKVAVALPKLQPGTITGFVRATLQADRAVELDCPTIRRRIRDEELFHKGFVVIVSEKPFDVVAVYTTTKRGGAPEEIATMDIERVKPRHIEDASDLLKELTIPETCEGVGCCCQTSADCSTDHECIRDPRGGPNALQLCQRDDRLNFFPDLRPTEPPFCRAP